jgi:hypothetical protein
MSYGRFKSRDANRWGKKYPFVRVRKVPVLVGDTETWIETAILNFDGDDTHVYNFSSEFPAAPVVTATAVDSDDLDVASVNIFIIAVSSQQITVGASQVFTGTVAMQAIFLAERE